MFEYLRIIWRWLLPMEASSTASPVGRPSQAVTKPRPLHVTNFVYPTIVVNGSTRPAWSRELIERSNALDSTKPTGPIAQWLTVVAKVEQTS